MIEVAELHRTYGRFIAVDHLSFKIGKGEIVGLLGHNGAGKTTIMKMLSGYLEPDQGQIRIDGLDLSHQPQQVKQRIGYLPESLPVYPELNVAEYLEYAAALKGIEASQRPQEIRRVIAATDLQAKLLAPIETLSRGQKQRVGVAQAILGNPRVLILDEPTNGLDPSQTQQMRKLIRDLAQQATVILSTHIMQEVEALCDRVLIIRDGQLIVDESLAQIQRADTFRLDSDISQERLRGLLKNTDAQLVRFTPQGSHHRYRIQITQPEQMDAVISHLCRQLIDAGNSVYRVQPEQRDLELLFREANEQEELADVA